MKKSRKFLVLFMLIILVLGNITVYAKDSDIKVYIDGVQLITDEPPMIKDNRVLVPFRVVFELLGFNVRWEAEARQINAERTNNQGKIYCNIQLDNNLMIVMVDDNISKKSYVNEIIFEIPSQIINGRTLIPLRAVSEALGCDVAWNDNNKVVTITANNKMPSQIKNDSQSIKRKQTDENVVSSTSNNSYPVAVEETIILEPVIYSDNNKPVIGDTPGQIIKDTTIEGTDKYADAYRSGSIGECVWYAKGRFYEVHGIKLDIYYLGAISEWIENAEHPLNIVTQKKVETPFITAVTDIENVQPLSIAVYKANELTSTGHVVFIEYVERDSSGNPAYVYITESNGSETLNRGQFDPRYDGIVQKIAYNDFISKSNLIGYIIPIK